MTTAEILGIVGSALGGGTLGAVATAWAARGKAREASATAVVGPLLERVDTLEERLDTCEERHAVCERMASGLSERVANLERDVGDRDASIRELQDTLRRRDADITQRVRAEVRRTVTPPDMPVHPAEDKEG